MASKRDLKKYIKYTCADIAGECVFAMNFFNGIECDKMEDIIVKAAYLQTETIDKVSVSYDKTLKSFNGNAYEYNKARKTYFKECYKSLRKELANSVNALVIEMNSAITQEQKAANKAALEK